MCLMLRYPLIPSHCLMRHCLIICLMSPIQALTQILHHHQVLAPLPLQMEALVQGSLILIDHGYHCDLA